MQKRFEGRTIALLVSETAISLSASSDNGSSATMINGIQEALEDSGAAVVRIVVHTQSFGLQDSATLSAIQRIVAPVEGETYEETVAKRLVREWSYTYVSSNGSGGTGDTEGEVDGSGVGSMAPSTEDYQAIQNRPITEVTPQTPFQQYLYDQYPLTRYLLTNKIISIEANYQSLLEGIQPYPTSGNLISLQLASAWQIPYGVNGVVDMLTTNGSSVAKTLDQVGLQIAQEFDTRGAQNALPYPSWLKNRLIALVGNSVAAHDASYFAVLANVDASSSVYVSNANSYNLSTVTTPTELSGRYSVIALLSGAPRGIYGQDREQSMLFPAVPADTTGRIPFA